jgi:hypothetical protein
VGRGFGLTGGKDLKLSGELIPGVVGLLGMGGVGKLGEFVSG